MSGIQVLRAVLRVFCGHQSVFYPCSSVVKILPGLVPFGFFAAFERLGTLPFSPSRLNQRYSPKFPITPRLCQIISVFFHSVGKILISPVHVGHRSTTKRDNMSQRRKVENKSLGTVLSEKLRARANKHSDEEREKSIAEGLAVIYGGGNKRHAKAAHRS